MGRAFIAVGAVVLLFVGYQLWATDWINAREQRALKSEVRERIAEVTPPTSAPPLDETDETDADTDETDDGDTDDGDTDETDGDTDETAPAPELIEAPPLGEPLGLIEIPAIDVEEAVVEGIGRSELQKGPGHYPHSPLPGRSGNVSIAGHRTTYGAPFGDIDALEGGDEIIVTTPDGVFTYVVAEQHVVDPSDVSVVEHTDDARLTLTTCHPRYSARERLIVVAHLDGDPVDAAPVDVVPDEGEEEGRGSEGEGKGEDEDEGDPAPPLPTEPALDELSLDTIDGSSDSGLSAVDQGTVLWTLILAAVSIAWWLAVRTRPRWYSRLGGVLPFLVVLFFFFGEVESLLPANF